jgi:hypothetical protein
LWFREVEIFPPVQCNRHVTALPDEIVESAAVEFVALLHSRVGEEFHDLQLADLVSDSLAGDRSRKPSLSAARFIRPSGLSPLDIWPHL